jgi:hypothetical protein
MQRSSRLLQALVARKAGPKLHPSSNSSHAGVITGQLTWQARASTSANPAAAGLQVSRWVQVGMSWVALHCAPGQVPLV